MTDLFGQISPSMQRSAVLSDCDRFRYSLTRRWDPSLDHLVWVMLNPSTADADTDDQSSRKVAAFSRLLGFGGFTIVNLFAWRARDPKELFVDPSSKIGAQNDTVIVEVCRGRHVIAAWGTPGHLAGRDKSVTAMLRTLGCQMDCLGTTGGGFPRHPLYLPLETPLVPFKLLEAA